MKDSTCRIRPAARSTLGRIAAGVLAAISTAPTPPAQLGGEPPAEPTTCVAVSDLDGDGWPDVVFGNRGRANQLFYNDGKGDFDEISPDVVAQATASTLAVVLGDIDGDRRTDILFLDSAGRVQALVNSGERRFTVVEVVEVVPAGANPGPATALVSAMALGDLDADGDPDLVLTVLGAANRLLLNDGKGRFTGAPLPEDSEHTTVVHLADLDGDRDLDILFGNRQDAKGRGGQNVLLLNDGKAGFIPGALPREQTSSSTLVLLDLDGDGRLDIFKGVIGSRGGRPRQYRNAGGGAFRGVKSSFTPGALIDLRLAAGGDFDGDGDQDLLLCRPDAPLLLWDNDGAGKLRPAPADRLPATVLARAAALAVADLDQDGDLDVVVANDGAPNLLLRNQGGGRFVAVPGVAFLDMGSAALLAEIRAAEKQLGFTMADQETAGGGRYRARRRGRKNLGDPRIATAISAGLGWLLRHQNQDGRWDSDGFVMLDPKDDRCTGPGKPVYDTAVTALALLALLAEGNTPFLGKHRDSVARGFEFLRRQQRADGCFSGPTMDFIYAHCMAALAVCEGYGLSGDPRLKASAQAAVDYLATHRSDQGAWGYEQGKGHCDTPITVWVVQACRAASDFGLRVNQADLAQALAWLDKVTLPDHGIAGYREAGEIGSRHPGDHGQRFPIEHGVPLTAAALYSRYLLGTRRSKSKVLDRAARTMLRHPPKHAAGYTDHYYWFYGSQAMHQHGGESATAWCKKATAALLGSQCQEGSARGSFDADGVWGEDGGRIYSTALAVLSLQAPYREAVLDPR